MTTPLTCSVTWCLLSSHSILNGASKGSIRGELLPNCTVLVKWPANCLRCSPDSTILWAQVSHMQFWQCDVTYP
jgi:hypothetical protein